MGMPANRIRGIGPITAAAITTIRIYDDIGHGTGAASAVTPQITAAGEAGNNIVVMISSMGGNVSDALAIVNAIKAFAGHTTTIIDGLALSAASMIAASGDVVQAYAQSIIMVHGPRAAVGGTRADFQNAAELMGRVETTMQEVYARGGKVSTSAIALWLEGPDDQFFTPEEAMAVGLVDAVLNDGKAEARTARVAAALPTLSKVPERIAASFRRVNPMDRKEQLQALFAPHGDAYKALLAQCLADESITVEAAGTKLREAIGTAAAASAAEQQRVTAIRAAFDGKGHDGLRDQCLADKTVTVEAAATKLTDAIATAQSTDPRVVAREAINAERTRVSDITAAFAPHEGHEALRDTLIGDGSPVADARDQLLTALSTIGTGASGTPRLTITDDARDRTIRGMSSAMMLRGGLLTGEAATAQDDNEFRGYSMLDMLAHLHQSRTGERLPRSKIAALAMQHITAAATGTSTSDFPLLLEDAINKSLRMGWMEHDEVYPMLTRPVPVSDFKYENFYALSSMTGIHKLPEYAEYEQGKVLEERERAQLATEGFKFGVSRQQLINDDLNAFTRIPMGMAMACRRAVGDDFHGLLYANADMADSVSLFSAVSGDRKSANTGSAKIDSPGVEKVRVAMATHKDPNGTTVYFAPSYVLCREGDYGAFRKLLMSMTEIHDANAAAKQGSNAAVPNISVDFVGMGNVLHNYRLDATADAANKGFAAGTYFVLSDPTRYDTIVMLLLDGQTEPYTEMNTPFDRDMQEWKIRFDYAFKAIDYRGLYKATA